MTFVSWTTEDGTPFDFSQPVREDVTLYATWKVRMFVVTFYDGENVLYTQEYSYGSVIAPPDFSEQGRLPVHRLVQGSRADADVRLHRPLPRRYEPVRQVA